jgi:hypothetical protein
MEGRRERRKIDGKRKNEERKFEEKRKLLAHASCWFLPWFPVFDLTMEVVRYYEMFVKFYQDYMTLHPIRY